jgi:hypothetical protein
MGHMCGFKAALSQEVGARATGHVAALELPCARRRELAPRDAWQHLSCPEPGLRSWGHGTHGGTRAAPSQEAGAGATGGVAAPELPVSGGITRCHEHVGACERMSCPSS